MSTSDFSLDAPAKPLPDLPGGDDVAALRAWSGGLLVMLALALGGWWWWKGATTGSWSVMLQYQLPGLGRWLDTTELGRLLVPLSGIQPGRSAGLVMAVLAAVALGWSVWRRQPRTAGWRQPEWWLLGAMAWQLGVLLADGRFVEPGMVWWWERAAALALATGLAWRWTGNPGRGVAACAVVGMAVMGLDTLSRLPADGGGSIGDKYSIGVGSPFGLPNFNMGGGVPLLGVAFGWLLAAARPGLTISGGVGAAILVFLCIALPLECWYSAKNGWAPDLSANKVALWAVFGTLGTALLLTLRSGPVLGPAMAIGLAGALAGATGMWVGTANLMTWVGLGAIVVAGVFLRLPGRTWKTPVLILALVAGFALVGWMGWAMSTGQNLWTAVPGEPKPSVLQRLFCMGQSYEAFAAAPLTGYGTGTTVGVLQLQPSYPGAWLSVPSYLEHAHNESWQILVEGGIVGAVILAVALAFTLVPLWRRRDEPMAKALLVGWAAMIAQAQVESHLSQPGPLLCLAVLAAATWAFIRTPVPVTDGTPAAALDAAATADAPWPVRPTVGMIILLLLGLAAAVGEVRNGLREMGGFRDPQSIIGSGGSPSAVVHRLSTQWRDAPSPAEKAAVLAALESRLGPLDILPGNRAAALLEDLQSKHPALTLEQLQPVVDLMIGQLRRMPADAGNLYRSSLLAAQMGAAGTAFRTEVRASLAKAEAWLARVPRTPHGGDEADRLKLVVDHLRAHGYPADPAPAPAEPRSVTTAAPG